MIDGALLLVGSEGIRLGEDPVSVVDFSPAVKPDLKLLERLNGG